MATSTLVLLLQLVASLLTGAQHNANLTPGATEATIAIASQAVQLTAQAEVMPKIAFAIPPNDSNDPDMKDLMHSAYLDAAGNYVPAGSTVNFDTGNVSFGDINQDGFDDAAVIVQQADMNGNTTEAIAAMLNQGGIMFNIADYPLDGNPQITSHNIIQGGDIVINSSTYSLVGDQLIKR